MTVVFKELAGSPVESYSPQGMQAERKILCAWADRDALLQELLGDGYEFGGYGRAKYPGKPGIVAMRARVDPFVKKPDDKGQFNALAEDLNTYEIAQVTANYELLPEVDRPDLPTPESNTFLTYRMDFGGEYEELNSQSFVWENNPDAVVTPDPVPTQRIPTTEHHVTWHRVVNPPWAAIRNTTGTVNYAAFMGAPAETVLFDGATADREFVFVDELAQPQFGWRINYVFREKVIKIGDGLIGGWNHRYRSNPANSPGWDRLKTAQGDFVYSTSDFSQLFQFAAQA